MSDLTKILAENQKEMSILIAPVVKKPATFKTWKTLILNSDSECPLLLIDETSTSKGSCQYYNNF